MADKVHCAHILVKNEALINNIRDRINGGESFAKMAEEYSIDGSKKRGGDLGWFGRGVMVKEFERAAFDLKKGEVSGVVKTQFGYHLIKRLE